ncbi:MAG: AbrB/MazE/SpoVT family DNA-binding domain-containing protein [Deltaproteobacteria bacterium]|nr:AbrB/MazE/SpoVT family DNA-binding domain-containing protein [Deltaproteobacteria bacterium]
MIVKITSKRQVTFPARVLDALGVGPGDQLELEEGPGGFVLRPRRINYSRLGTLRDQIPPGHPPFDIEAFRKQGYDPSLRD